MGSGIGSGNSSIASSPRSAETTSGTAATPHEDFENALAGPTEEAGGGVETQHLAAEVRKRVQALGLGDVHLRGEGAEAAADQGVRLQGVLGHAEVGHGLGAAGGPLDVDGGKHLVGDGL